ncbi:MAG: HNH endonuclease [Saprospiraceae bacterium]|nr:HNH endonuclease [Saprospiraceae bacterium]
MPKKISDKLKSEVKERAAKCCEYCMAQERYSHDYFSVEHIIPNIKEGSSTEDNLANSCQACNNHKYIFTEAIDPITGQTVPLFHPRKHQWKQHFTWDETNSIIIGITPIGRATVERLCMNRKGLVNLRLVLVENKKHPTITSI